MPTSKRHYRVTWEDALESHAAALEAGGCPGILNRGLIESALARPYDGWHRLIHQKAAALVHSFVKNHGFADGNKRTALYVADLLTVGAGIVSLLRRKTWKT
ncbi:MAG: type II toxin-antitoxin system death-on-curing family toxin [Gammaproteobacteria bacterium]